MVHSNKQGAGIQSITRILNGEDKPGVAQKMDGRQMNEPPPIPEQPARSSAKSSWCLGLSIAGMCCLGPIATIPAIVLGHIALSSVRKSRGQARGRASAIVGLWIGYTSLIAQAVLITGLVFADQITYRLKCLTTPRNYVFHMAIQDPSCGADTVAFVLSRRLRTAGVPHEIGIASPSTLEVQFATDEGMPVDAAKELLVQTGRLEFRMVHPRNDEAVNALFERGLVPDGYTIVSMDEQGANGQWRSKHYYKRDKTGDPEGATEADIRNRLNVFKAPAGYEFMLVKNTKQGQEVYSPYFVSKNCEMTGESLESARVDYQQFGQPILTLKFSARGAERFAAVTSDYAPGGAKNPSPGDRRYLAIVLDGTLYSAPFIKTTIHGGQAIIEGSFTLKEARHLASVLTAGQLPCRVVVTQEGRLDR